MAQIDRFLRHRPAIAAHHALGLGYSLVRETWDLSADPKATKPLTEVVASARSASDAADLGRSAAVSYARHGFHKPSGAWWAVDERLFHRFAVRPRHRTRNMLLVGLGLAGLAGPALLKRRRGAPLTPGPNLANEAA